MDKGTTNFGIPVFGEVVKMLDKEEIMQIAVKLQADRYTKRLDSYQHLIIMLFATLGEFVSLRELEIGFPTSASRMNHFGMDYMVRRSTLSDVNTRRTPPSSRQYITVCPLRVLFVGQPARKWAEKAVIYHGLDHDKPILTGVSGNRTQCD